MILNVLALRQIMPLLSVERALQYIQPLNDAMEINDINTPERVAAFIAQIAHESAELRYVQEIASGVAYEGRKDLGNVVPGDGMKFKGRGPIQVTGRSNYQQCSLDMYGDERLMDNPALLEQPFDGCMASAWFWKRNGLNERADRGDFLGITKTINGGLNGLTNRDMYYKRAREVLGLIA
jgi:predicted chitinase